MVVAPRNERINVAFTPIFRFSSGFELATDWNIWATNCTILARQIGSEEDGVKFVKPSPLGASKAAVYSFAEDVAKHVKYEIRENMRAFVSRLGGRISFHEEVRPDDDFPESIVVQPTGEFQIFLPTVTTAERDRFTIAHELGHLFLHFPKVKRDHPGSPMAATRRVDQNDAVQKRAEWEANWFAAAFLMPEQTFRQYHAAHGAAGAAAKFGVSQSAAEVRASTLGL